MKKNLGGIKHDSGKPRMSLLPTSALTEAAKVLTFGERKYASHNWRKGFDWSRLLDAMIRHATKYNNGERKDEESGLSHIAHAVVNGLFLLEHEIHNLGNDDLWKGYNNVDKLNSDSGKKTKRKRSNSNKKQKNRRRN